MRTNSIYAAPAGRVNAICKESLVPLTSAHTCRLKICLFAGASISVCAVHKLENSVTARLRVLSPRPGAAAAGSSKCVLIAKRNVRTQFETTGIVESKINLLLFTLHYGVENKAVNTNVDKYIPKRERGARRKLCARGK